ncbi:hypothetical protein Tco_0247420 [Tanacetum coccineum]
MSYPYHASNYFGMGSLDILAIDGPSLGILVIDGPLLEIPLLSSELSETLESDIREWDPDQYALWYPPCLC